MSGICIAVGAEDGRRRVEAMVAAMARYGQRTATLELEPGLACARAYHGRLAAERAPETDADGITVLIDGEIFNQTGPLARPEEAVAELYRKDARGRLAHLNGSFSAIIHDPREERIVLAGDRLGSRPLFVWQEGSGLAAASRLDALLADDRVPRRLSLQGLVELVTYQRTMADHTQYADIHATSGAAVWSFTGGRLERRRSWRLAWRTPDFDEREGAERLTVALKNAARRCTADDARHGLLLSGGLDSRLVLAAARAAGHTPACLTAGALENQEIGIARRVARAAGAPFRFIPNPPEQLSGTLDAATDASHGLFSAPMNLFGLLPGIAREHDVVLSGHGLDYTLRGFYLPCVMVRVAGSVTRLPRLRPVPDGTPATVADSLRVGISRAALKTALSPEMHAEWDTRRVAAVTAALEAADIENPYNAWDAFVLHCLGRHYAYSDFVAMGLVIDHRAIAFDAEVFDLYLAMPPEWRAAGRMAHAAMRALDDDLMAIPDANTGFPARHGFWRQIALLFARATARRLGLARPPKVENPNATQGSWANYAELFRRDPIFVERLKGLSKNPALMDTGLFAARGLDRLVDDHLTGRADHKKLFLEVLSLASWLERHGYSAVVHDG